MKEKLLNIWEKIADVNGVALGCAFAATLFFCLVAGIVLILKWIWSLTWIKNATNSAGDFITEYSNIFEYIFVGGFFLYLAGCLVVGIIALIQDNRKSIVKRAKAALEWLLKCIFILILIAFCLFFLHECSYNSHDVEPQLYEHRM